MSVHYKFKSNLDHDTVTFDGLSISVADLKKSIMHQKKIGKSSDFDLQITNAQTKEVYNNDETLVPKNTSVIVARVPVSTGNKKSWDRPDLPLPIGLDDDDLGQIRYDRIAKSADLVNAIATEEDKVKAMITQSSQEYDPSKYVKSRSMTGPLPPTYTCYRCGNHGHWIKDCPTNNPDVKRSTGIPRSFMVPVDGPEHRGALLTSSGDYAVPLIDHQAYKEVKKEKPPFVPQDEPAVEPEAQIPEELLCMLCRDLLQDAVLIPCCGNSFCDECVRQVLLESDNHECPLCHETEISPDTVIPNRFLRTAVLNFKNETGYTRVKRLAVSSSSQFLDHVDSPQPSPDSTVEPHSLPPGVAIEVVVETSVDVVIEAPEAATVVVADNAEENVVVDKPCVESPERTDVLKDCLDAEIEDIQPGTPLADEPAADVSQPLPIQAIGHESYHSDGHDESSKSRYSHQQRRADYNRHHRYSERRSTSPKAQQIISIIPTIGQNYRIHSKSSYAPGNSENRFQRRTFRDFENQRHNDHPDNYERGDYQRRYNDRRYNDRPPHRPFQHFRDYRPSRDSRYHNTEQEHSSEHSHHDSHYESHLPTEDSNSRRHQERYASPPRQAIHVDPPMLAVPPVYTSSSIPPPVPVPIAPMLVPHVQVYAMQPPPPGSDPIDTCQAAAQPPPPGVGPLIPPSHPATDPGKPFAIPFDSEDPLKEPKKKEERSIDDQLEAFQRELEERDRKHTRERVSRSRSRSIARAHSRTSSRSFSSSKSWTRSPTRSSHSRTTRSHSRTPFTSRSRSYTRSRTRSWSKPRSYTRSRSRTRTESRSRSRSRNEPPPRIRRKIVSPLRDRIRSPLPHRPRSRSHSYSPKDYRNHRTSYQSKRMFTPPRYGSSYQHHSPYGAPPAVVTQLPEMRPPSYPPHHIHPIHTVTHPVQPVGHYQVDRPRFDTYNEEYPPFEVYTHPQQKPYERVHQRFEREQRIVRFDKRPEFQRQEEAPHRIPGWMGDRSRESNVRYRAREQRKEIIKELPKVSDYEMKSIHAKEVKEEAIMKKKEEAMLKKKKEEALLKKKKEEAALKKKEEKSSTKHKKHHHKSKDIKKHERQENKIQVIVGVDKHGEMSQKFIKVETRDKVAETSSVSTLTAKSSEKSKERKHKHKKHKVNEQPTKKKKTSKKERTEESASAEISDVSQKVKTKKKKIKVKKIIEETQPQDEALPVEQEEMEAQPVAEQEEVPIIAPELAEEEKIPDAIKSETPPPQDEVVSRLEESQAVDTLDIFADDVDSEAGLVTEVTEELDSEAPLADTSNEVLEEVETAADSIEKEEDGHAGDSEEAEEEIEEEEREDVLHVDVPALSKWEREEYEEVFTLKPQRRSAITIPKEGKGALSSDIIQRAEKVILSKPLKTAILNANKEKGTVKSVIKEESLPSQVSPAKSKEIVSDIKSVVSTERLPSPTLQVTISTVKEKRSVRSKKDSSSSGRDDSGQSKRVKLDRSGFKTSESSSRHRTVTVAEGGSSYSASKSDDRQKEMEYGQRSSGRREGRRYSPEREFVMSGTSSQSRDKREVDKSGSHYQADVPSRHDRRERKRHPEYERSARGDSRDRKTQHEHVTHSRDRRPQEKNDSSKSYESHRKETFGKHLRSESESSESHYSRKVSRAKHPVSVLAKKSSREKDKKEVGTSSESSTRLRKHSPIKAPETSSDQPSSKHKPSSSSSSKHFHHDVLKFEPDYDEFSDVESRRSETKKKLKRVREPPDNGKKRLKQQQQEDLEMEENSTSSSSQSSEESNSDSSDDENVKVKRSKSSDADHKQKNKKAKHKKHKKHKRKHKKKKSHKSK